MFFCMQKTAYELRISDWSSDVCSSDLADREHAHAPREIRPRKPESDVENQARIEPRFRRAEQEAQDVEHLGRSGEGEPQRRQPPGEHDPGEPEARAEPVDAERAGDLEKDVPDIEKRRAEREYRFAHPEKIGRASRRARVGP